MPKVNYEKQPFRVCRWNRKYHGSEEGSYWCDEAEEIVQEDECMKCFCNTWFNTCPECNGVF